MGREANKNEKTGRRQISAVLKRTFCKRLDMAVNKYVDPNGIKGMPQGQMLSIVQRHRPNKGQPDISKMCDPDDSAMFTFDEIVDLAGELGVSIDWLLGASDQSDPVPEEKIKEFTFRDLAGILATLWKLGYIKIFTGSDAGKDSASDGFYIYFPVSSEEFMESKGAFFHKMAMAARKKMFEIIGHDYFTEVRGAAASLMKYNNQSLGAFLLNDVLPLQAVLELPGSKESWIDTIIHDHIGEVSNNKIAYHLNSLEDSFYREEDGAEVFTHPLDCIPPHLDKNNMDLFFVGKDKTE